MWRQSKRRIVLQEKLRNVLEVAIKPTECTRRGTYLDQIAWRMGYAGMMVTLIPFDGCNASCVGAI